MFSHMVTLEKIETMRARTDASFREAKAALEATDGDLEAAILLYEKQKAQASGFGADASQDRERAAHEPHQKQDGRGSAHHKSERESHRDSNQKSHHANEQTPPPGAEYQDEQTQKRYRPHFGEGTGYEASSFLHSLWRLLMELFQRSITTHFSVYKNGGRFFSIPLFAFAVVFLASFWLTPILLIIGLFAGFTYHIVHF